MKKTITIITVGIMLMAVSAKSQVWTTQNAGPVNAGFVFNSVSAVDANVAWGFSKFSYVAGHTVDGGTTWELDSTPSGTLPGCLQALSMDTAWVSTVGGGDSARLWKTTDRGQTWIKKSVASTNWDFFYFFNSNEAVVFGDPINGAWPVYITGDGGTSWTPVSVPAPLSGEACMDLHHSVFGDHIWTTSTRGRIFYSSDKGHTWNVSTIVSASFPDVFRVAFYTAQEAIAIRYVVGTDTVSEVYRSHDGGVTWNMIPHTGSAYQSFYGGFFIIPGSNVVIANGDGTTNHGSSYSTDSGSTWTVIDNANKYGGIDGKGWNSLWAGQYSTYPGVGGVVKWDGTPVNVTGVAAGNSFSYYPNPVSDHMVVRSKDKIDEIKIVDLLGKELISLKGQHAEEQVEVNTLANGIYFIRIKSANRITTQKFVKL